jgi:hypothetical protein
MNFDFLGVLAIFLTLGALDIAALRWGVDSRFTSRTDFDRSAGFIGGFPHVHKAPRP